MDLSSLNQTLPPGLADAERDMGDKFRAAALSITNLYKSSLSYTKQAYHVGYSSCLSDVLSTVQSSIGAGQDASQTLSRLMDWAEAREAAMAAFAAEESDDPPPPPTTIPPKVRTTQARQALNSIHNHPKTTTNHIHPEIDDSSPIPARPQAQMALHTSTPVSEMSMEQVAVSPSSPTRSITVNRVKHRSPIRHLHPHPHSHYRQDPTPSSSSSRTAFIPPSSTFQPALPHEARKAMPHVEVSGIAPNQNAAVGTKRPMVEVEMSVDEREPVTPARSTSTRAAKRRTLGKGEDGGEEGGRTGRRGGKRGHGAGGGGAVVG